MFGELGKNGSRSELNCTSCQEVVFRYIIFFFNKGLQQLLNNKQTKMQSERFGKGLVRVIIRRVDLCARLAEYRGVGAHAYVELPVSRC